MALTYGIELEGGWSEQRYYSFSGMRGDGSVHVSSPFLSGEISVGVYDNLRKLYQRMREVYPDTVNHTCGLHVHVGGTPGELSGIASVDCYNDLIQKLRETAHPAILSRLAGNQYARCRYTVPEQLDGRDNNRYTAINGCAYREHRTIEFRILPAFPDWREAMKYIGLVTSVAKFHATKPIRIHYREVI